MSLPVHWSALAIEHLAAIALYIRRTSPIYAQRTIDRILDRAESLGTFPELGVRASETDDENVREIFEASYRILYLAQPSRVDIPRALAELRCVQHTPYISVMRRRSALASVGVSVPSFLPRRALLMVRIWSTAISVRRFATRTATRERHVGWS